MSVAVLPRPGVPLAPLSTIGVGGPAKWLVTIDGVDAAAAADKWARDRGLDLMVIGGGSNVVIADDGLDALVVRTAGQDVTWRVQGDDCQVDAGAGLAWDALVERAVADGWAGIECLSGIPGTVGGTPIQNVGAYGQDVGSILAAVLAYDRAGREAVILPAESCGFAYRDSRFKGVDADRFIVCRVTYALRRSAATSTYPDVDRWLRERDVVSPSVRDVRAAVLAIRRGKGMIADGIDGDARSVGSFFMNPVVSEAVRFRLEREFGAGPPARAVGPGLWRVPAAWLIERAGWTRGDGEGCVGLSTKHPLAIVNRGGARASDIVRFAARVKRQVVDRCGVYVVPEPVFLGFGDDADVAYLRKAHD